MHTLVARMRKGLHTFALAVILIALCASGARASTPAAPGTPEAAADELAAALTASDFTKLEALISPNGFNWARSGSGGLPTKTPQEAVAFLRTESGGRLDVTTQTRPLHANTVGPFPGTLYITSTWRNFGNVPTQQVNLVLDAVGGAWNWSGALTNAPPPSSCTSSAGPGIPHQYQYLPVSPASTPRGTARVAT